MAKTIKYTGSEKNWDELAYTGKQSVWYPGWTDSREDSEANTLIGTGLFVEVRPDSPEALNARVTALEAAGPGGSGVADGDKGDITVAGTGAVWTIENNAVTNAKAADMATATIKGRTTAGTGDPEDLTSTQATALLNTFTTSLKGLAPASGGGTTNFLRADGSWAAPPGGAGVSDGDKGDIAVTASGATWTIDNAAVTDAKISNRTALSVFGRATNSVGVGADIAATVDGQVLRRSGGALAFGTLVSGSFASNTIPLTALATQAANTILANATAGAASPTAIALSASQLFGRGATGDLAPITLGTNLSMSGTTLNASGGGGSGTVTSVGMSVPTGLSVAGSPITTSGTFAVTLAAGYVIPTQATLDDKVSSSAATNITATKAVLVAADKFISIDSAASNVPKLTRLDELNNSLARLPSGTGLATTGTVNLDLAAIAGTEQRIVATGNITFTASNYADGQFGTILIDANGATRTLAWPAFTSFGAALLTSLASGKLVRVAWKCTGTTAGSVHVAFVESV